MKLEEAITGERVYYKHKALRVLTTGIIVTTTEKHVLVAYDEQPSLLIKTRPEDLSYNPNSPN